MPIDPRQSGPAIDSILNQLLGPVNKRLRGIIPTPPTDVSNYVPNPEQATPLQIGAAGILGALQAMGAGGPGIRGVSSTRNMSQPQLRAVNAIEEFLSSNNIRYQVEIPSSTNQSTAYIRFRNPHSKRKIDEQIIRVPSDGHLGYVTETSVGQNLPTNLLGNLFDTGHRFDTRFARGRSPQPEYATNVAGEPFSQLPILFDAVSHRNSLRLVSPGREPRYSPRISEGGTPMTMPYTNMGRRGVVESHRVPEILSRITPTNRTSVRDRLMRQPRQLDFWR